jgi:hypothetical protein
VKGCFLWQTADVAERSIDQVAETLLGGGCDTLLVKANDGSAWMSRFDGGFGAVSGLASLETWRAGLARYGIRLVPWGNPRSPGLNEDVEELARMTAAIARTCGSYDFDVEPGPLYWRALDAGDTSGVVPFFARVRELAPTARLVLDFPGSWAWGRITRLLELAEPYVDAFEIQSYWDPARARSDEARLRQITAKPIAHIAYYTHLPAMLEWLAAEGRADVLVLDFAHMSAPLYQRLAAFNGSRVPGPASNGVGLPSSLDLGPSTLDSSLDPFVVGEGIAAAMRAHGDEPLTDEGQPPLRWAVGRSGRIYVYSPASNRVAVMESDRPGEPSVIAGRPAGLPASC